MWFYFFFGVIQGIFEWIPISSEGILTLLGHLFLKDINPLDVALFLHLGTVFSALFYFHRDWKEVLFFKNQKLARFLIISTLLSLAVGFPIYRLIKSITAGSSLLAITGFGLLFTAYFHKTKRFCEMDFNKLAVINGFLQGFSVIPGLSRSGVTIFGLSLGKISPSEILKISYMMSVPLVLASSFYLFLTEPILIDAWPALISSFLVGFLTLDILIKFSRKINLFKFALFFSILCFLGAAFGFFT